MFLLRVILCLGVLSGSFSPRSALAEEGESPEYTEAVNLGIAEFEQKNFIEARAHFARAHKLYPNARTMRALGMAAFELKKYIESVEYMSQALASRERPLDAEKRKLVEKLLERARTFLAHITIVVQPDADVSVDGAPALLSAEGELVLEAGDHVIELKAPGYISERRTLELKGGEQETLRVRLRELGPTDRPESSSSGRDDSARRPLYKNPWLWSAVGVVVIGAAAGTAIALTRDHGTETKDVYLGNSGAAALQGPSKP